MKNKINALTFATGAALLLASVPTFAEITLIQADPQPNDPLSRLTFQVGGSIRPQMNNMAGDDGANGYKRNGFDGGTRFRFTADYYLFDDISWTSFYEIGVNLPKILNWDNHYASGAFNTQLRHLYTGLKSDTWGTLTYGKQNSVYYNVIGVKTDIWGYDMLAQAPGVGIQGDYDGTYHARDSLKYMKKVDNVDLYASYLFEDSNYRVHSGKNYNGFSYKRKGGGSLGVDYHITKDLLWGTAWNYTRADMRYPGLNESKTWDQHIVGTALSWKPGNWTLTAGGGWYKNFLVRKQSDKTVNNYFAGDAWGVEYLAGYSFPVAQYGLKAIMPYFMGDRLEYINGSNYKRIDNGVGLTFKFQPGFQIEYEHMFTSSTDNLGDMNYVRVRYDF
ncbi:porin [Pluralibacter gergoviae]|uniref:porin n=1 Tax=Pluralibacter gergoviae TaxID=61647 RepID=UPI00155DE7B4|nr:autotransporter domain-containing protein [Pluralibacter gergoviae]